MSIQDQKQAESGGFKGAVRLRKANRAQMRMLMQCADDLVSQKHPVRTVARFVQSLGLSAFCKPIKARKGQAGQSATDPALLVSLTSASAQSSRGCTQASAGSARRGSWAGNAVRRRGASRFYGYAGE
jgi:hypothetical protein